MLALAGLPATAGFMGKLFLIEATVDDGYTWLGVAIVIGSMVSLAYYMRVIAAMWMKPTPTALPAIAGGATDESAPGVLARRGHDIGEVQGRALLAIPALICAAATVGFGVWPDPLIDWAHHAATSLTTFV
jgi:NADH-quinone oxidoreductase subunit N